MLAQSSALAEASVHSRYSSAASGSYELVGQTPSTAYLQHCFPATALALLAAGSAGSAVPHHHPASLQTASGAGGGHPALLHRPSNAPGLATAASQSPSVSARSAESMAEGPPGHLHAGGGGVGQPSPGSTLFFSYPLCSGGQPPGGWWALALLAPPPVVGLSGGLPSRVYSQCLRARLHGRRLATGGCGQAGPSAPLGVGKRARSTTQGLGHPQQHDRSSTPPTAGSVGPGLVPATTWVWGGYARAPAAYPVRRDDTRTLPQAQATRVCVCVCVCRACGTQHMVAHT